MENTENAPESNELETASQPESYVAPVLTKHKPLHALTGKSGYEGTGPIIKFPVGT